MLAGKFADAGSMLPFGFKTSTKKKKEILENYLKEGIGFDIIPADIVEEYGIADVQSTYEVAVSQSKQEGKSIEQIAAYTVPVF